MRLTGAVRDNAANMQELIREGRVYHNDSLVGVVHLSPTTEIFWEDPVYRIRTASGGEKTLVVSRLWINWGDKEGAL